jgi:hypothetical protein
MIFDSIVNTSSIVIAVGVVIAAIIAVYKILKKFDSVIGQDEQGRTISERLDRVEHQLWENGGSSLADRVNNIEKHVIKVSTEIDLIKDITLGLASDAAETRSSRLLPPIKESVLKPKSTRSKKAS